MQTSNPPKDVLAFVDAPDPDNFVMLVALAKLFPEATVHVILTGRPVKFKATKECKLWDWDKKSSLLAQESSAARIKNFMRHFGVRVTNVYDGGIAHRTLVPHHIHFADYYRFLDVDPLAAIRHSELEPQEELIKLILAMEPGSTPVSVGGPMTGLYQLIGRCPEIVSRFSELHAMFATWGTVQLMQMDAAPRGAVQFNAACDPQAAHAILMGLDIPIYIMPSEVTRVKSIGFENAVALRKALPENDGTRQLYQLYALWYDAAVKPRQDKNPDELIFIHDLVSAFSLRTDLRNGIYQMVPVEITSVPHLPREQADWGKVLMAKTDKPTKCFAATTLTEGGAALYLKTLAEIFA